MSRRTKNPHCFYCNEPTFEGLSRIDSTTPVCTGCANLEAVAPLRMFERWISRGGDRLAAITFFQRVHSLRRVATSAGAL